MTPRERVFTTLSHQQPDRVPLEMSFTPEFAGRLRQHIFHQQGEKHNPHGGGNDYSLERALGLDLLLTSVGWANSYYAGDVYNPGGVEYTDEWGVRWKNVPYETRFGSGFYTEFFGHPLAEDEAIHNYSPPDPERPELYEAVGQTVSDFGQEYFIVGSCQTTVWETAVALRGFEDLLMDLIEDPDYVDQLLDIPLEYHRSVTKRMTEIGVDMIWLGDDMGAQNAMLIDPEQWRRFIKPRFASLINDLKTINPEVRIAYHSDGYILPILDELVEIGVDVLHPVQPACMNPAELKQRFGKQLSFMGTIDEQHTLPFGSPESVRKEVRERLDTVGKDGGFILAPTHHVQLDTPIENIEAMIDEAKNYERQKN